MQARGANLDRVGPFNRAVVLDAVRRTGGTSRVELAELTGLAPQTVTTICQRLLADGLVVEGERTSVGRGKPRTVLRLAAAGGIAVGVHLDPAVVTVALLDLAGTVLAHTRLPVAADARPADVIDAISGSARALVADTSVDAGRVLGLGLAAPGPVDLERGVVGDPPHLPRWRDLPVRSLLSRASGLPVLLAKDVTAAAVAETWSGGVGGGETAAVVHLGTGIGLGLVVDGTVVRGAVGNAGEIGHLVVADEGPSCSCGQRGCVAVVAAPARMVEEGRAAGLLPAEPARDPAVDVHRLFDAAAAGESPARRIVHRSATGITRLLLVVADLLDLDRVVLGGPYWELFAPALLAGPAQVEAAARLTARAAVVGTALGEHAGAVGAATLVLDAVVSPDPRRLVRAQDASWG